ncbi:hypothetical protein [Nitrosopumilus sp.]|uniref:hypothetical protein n=1 Tax=Nitrosopumilus sp. TaxID=2024843 RepID=UPI003B595AE6
MNPKIFVGIAIVGLIAVLGGILLMGSSVTIEPQTNNSVTDDQNVNESKVPTVSQALPLQIELDDISVPKISERTATIELAFKISNPNERSMIVQVMDYQLFETGYSETEQLSGGQIGNRPEGMVEFGSNYYTLLGENSIFLRDKIVLKNTGNTPELWSALEDGTAKWKVSGDVFYNLSSMTSGQENELHFEFTK